jgi:preprotein translocase subunit SecA
MRCPAKTHPTQYDWNGLETDILNQFGIRINSEELKELNRRDMETRILDQLLARYQEKEEMLSPELLRETERMIMLNVIDNQWKDHLLSMDHLKEGIQLRGYGQKDPLIEYKKESFTLFQDMMDRIEDETIRFLYFLQRAPDDATQNVPHPELWSDEEEEDEGETVGVASGPSDADRAAQKAAQNSVLDLTRNIQRKKEKEMSALQFVGGESTVAQQPTLAKDKGVGRNDPCPCGSGKKYKKCHGA